jgi:hypothetical protein
MIHVRVETPVHGPARSFGTVQVSTPHFLLAACPCARPEQIRVDLRRLPSRAGLKLRNEIPHYEVVIIEVDALILEEIEDPD